jgi:hypothetical protein
MNRFEPPDPRAKEPLGDVCALVRIPTYREFVSIRKVAHVMWALWHPERDKDQGNGGRDPDERDDNWMIR